MIKRWRIYKKIKLACNLLQHLLVTLSPFYNLQIIFVSIFYNLVMSNILTVLILIGGALGGLSISLCSLHHFILSNGYHFETCSNWVMAEWTLTHCSFPLCSPTLGMRNGPLSRSPGCTLHQDMMAKCTTYAGQEGSGLKYLNFLQLSLRCRESFPYGLFRLT